MSWWALRHVYKASFGKPEWKRFLGRLRSRWGDNMEGSNKINRVWSGILDSCYSGVCCCEDSGDLSCCVKGSCWPAKCLWTSQKGLYCMDMDISKCLLIYWLQVWDQDEHENWHLTASWKAHSGSVWKVTWAHPEFGQVLATCSFDRTAAVWEEIGKESYSTRIENVW